MVNPVDRPLRPAIRGWLLLLGLIVVLLPFRIVIALISNFGLLVTSAARIVSDQSLPTYDPLLLPAICFEGMGNIALLTGWIYVAILFFRRSIRLPRWYIVILLCSVVFAWVDLLLQTRISSPTVHAQLTLNRVSAIALSLWTLILTAYLRNSKRVKRTFVI
jgi:hypothetical protein